MTDIKEILPYYIGQRCIVAYNDGSKTEGVLTFSLLGQIELTGKFSYHIKTITLQLRRLPDMTEEEMIGLLQSMAPDDMEDKTSKEDYDLEMFYNDNATMVDGDIAVGANFTCICYEGQIAITQCGTIRQYDEAGKEERLINVPRAFHYLLKQGFDLFGLIGSGQAIDAKTLNHKA